MDNPEDPFEIEPPAEFLDRLRGDFPEETVAAFAEFLGEFSKAGLDCRALEAQDSWRRLIMASLTTVENHESVRVAAILVQAVGRAKYTQDPDGFGDWLRR